MDVNAQDVSGETALAYASSRGFLPVVNILLENGADPNIGNKVGQTPLIKAAIKNRSDIAEVLLANGAQMRHRDNTGLDAATYAKRHEFSEPFIEVLSAHHHSTKDTLTAKPAR